MPALLSMRELVFASSFVLASFAACAASAPFVEDFDDGQHSFQESATTSHQIGGGISQYSWPVTDVSGNKVLRGHIFLHNLDNDSASLVYTGKYISAANVAGGNFRFSVDVDISNLIARKANDPTVADESMTIALGVLGSGAFSPTSFVGFKDQNDGQHYYLAVYTVQLDGDAIDPWAADDAGALHLFEHGGDGQIDAVGTKSVKAASNFVFSVEGTYSAGVLTLSADVDAGGDKVLITDSDTTPLTGGYFGFRTAAFSRSGTTSSADVTFDVDFDNVSLTKDFQPDASIAKGNGNSYTGEGIVNTTGKNQQAKLKVIAGNTANATIRVSNSGTQTDSIKVTGAASQPGFNVIYLDGPTNVTNQVTGGGYTFSNLTPGQSKTLKFRVETSGNATGSKQFKVNTRSIGDSGARDAVKAKVIIK